MDNYDPSAPPEELVDINNSYVHQRDDYEESKDDSILAVTPGTAKIEKIAVKELDSKYFEASLFRNEQVAAYIWCTFIFLYWTPCVWFPLFYNELLLIHSAIEVTIWCIGFVALLITSYCLREGQNPSGSTDENPNSVDAKSRYAATLLIWCILVDFTVKIYGVEHGSFAAPPLYDLILIAGHTVSLFWCSFFYYGRFKQINPEIATFVFLSEWIDIVMTVTAFAVLVLYVNNGCGGHYLCEVYFIIIPIKFILWMAPMMMTKGWGTKPNGYKTSIQLFVTNLLTDLPIIIMIQHTQLYRLYTIIYVDLCLKSFVIIRGTSYYVIFNIWLKRGLQKERKARAHAINKDETVALKA